MPGGGQRAIDIDQIERIEFRVQGIDASQYRARRLDRRHSLAAVGVQQFGR